MKTLTEFPGSQLKQASKLHLESTTAGKTPEEISQAVGAELKVEGDRLADLIHALEVVGTKFQDLKRVVVFTLNEGEKAPSQALQKGEHYFTVEYYPPLVDKSRGNDRHGKPGRGEGRDRKGKGDRKRKAGDRPRGPANKDGAISGDKSDRKPRQPHFGRGPREPQNPNPSSKPPTIIPRPQGQPLKPVDPELAQARKAAAEALATLAPDPSSNGTQNT